MSTQNFVVCLAGLSGFAYFLFAEIRRENRHWLALRIAALGLAVAGLTGLGIAFPPAPQTTAPGSTGTTISDTGFQEIHWPGRLPVGQAFVVRGVYQNRPAFPVRIGLMAGGHTADSAIVPAGRTCGLELRAAAKQSGQGLFRLLVTHAHDTIENEPLPFINAAPDSLRVLLLGAAPGFENKFLAEWLARGGAHVTYRYRISRNRFETGYLHTLPVSLSRIGDPLLNGVDLLIADNAELAALSAGERALVARHVQVNGLGLVVRADTAESKKYLLPESFTLKRIPPPKDGGQLIFSVDTARHHPPADAMRVLAIAATPGMKSLVTDRNGTAFVGSRLSGKGKITCVAIDKTFPWMLAGNAGTYADFWQSVIGETAKSPTTGTAIALKENIPVVHRAVHFVVETRQASLPFLTIGSDTVFLAGQKRYPGRWEGVWWPRTDGWQPPAVANGDSLAWFVFAESEWPFPRPRPVAAPHASPARRFPFIYFFVFFMSGWCFLWLERKYYVL